MRFINDVIRHVVDLEQPPERRWNGVIAADLEVARALLNIGWSDALREAHEQTGRPMWLLKTAAAAARQPFHAAYRASRGRHLPEIYAWADALGEDRSLVVMLQCMYELSHLDPTAPPVAGCSAGACWSDSLGAMVHVRTLDWNLPQIGPATRVFEFRRGTRKHFVIGMPGLVGALSGMVPGGFSVTINWAPPAALPFFYLGPLIEIRDVLETCDTYAQAVDRFRNARLASSAFFTITGVNRGEACVVEHVKTKFIGGHDVRVQEITDGVIAQSNHYQHPDFARFNSIVDTDRSLLMKTSRMRAAQLEAALRKTAGLSSLDEFAACLTNDPVENVETRQKMLFCPARDAFRVWREA